MDTAKALSLFRTYIESFVVFNEAEWIVFMQYLSFSTLKKKRFFSEPGTVCSQFGFIAKGAVRYYHVKDGAEITGYFSFEKELVSAYKSFLTQTPAVNYIQALEDIELIIISYKNMQLMLDNPLLAYKMERSGRLVAEHYLICYEDRMSSFITKTPEERYLDLLTTGGDILRRMPQHYIAHFLGITPVSLSRIRRRILVHWFISSLVDDCYRSFCLSGLSRLISNLQPLITTFLSFVNVLIIRVAVPLNQSKTKKNAYHIRSRRGSSKCAYPRIIKRKRNHSPG